MDCPSLCHSMAGGGKPSARQVNKICWPGLVSTTLGWVRSRRSLKNKPLTVMRGLCRCLPHSHGDLYLHPLLLLQSISASKNHSVLCKTLSLIKRKVSKLPGVFSLSLSPSLSLSISLSPSLSLSHTHTHTHTHTHQHLHPSPPWSAYSL
jgi:hypothetical protein